jgi:hypothetical protein
MYNRVGKSNCLGYENEIGTVHVAITGLLDCLLEVFISSLIMDCSKLVGIIDVIWLF